MWKYILEASKALFELLTALVKRKKSESEPTDSAAARAGTAAGAAAHQASTTVRGTNDQ